MCIGKKKSLKWLLKLLSLHFPHIYSTFGILKQYTVHDFSNCYLGAKYERRQKFKKKKDKDFSIHEIYGQIPSLLQTVCALVCALVDTCYPFRFTHKKGGIMGRKMGFCADRNSGVTPSLKPGVQTKVRDCDPWMFSTQTCPFGFLRHYQMLPLHLALSLVSPSHELPLVGTATPRCSQLPVDSAVEIRLSLLGFSFLYIFFYFPFIDLSLPNFCETEPESFNLRHQRLLSSLQF